MVGAALSREFIAHECAPTEISIMLEGIKLVFICDTGVLWITRLFYLKGEGRYHLPIVDFPLEGVNVLFMYTIMQLGSGFKQLLNLAGTNANNVHLAKTKEMI